MKTIPGASLVALLLTAAACAQSPYTTPFPPPSARTQANQPFHAQAISSEFKSGQSSALIEQANPNVPGY